jgi:uncharacterized membrane-anchored protein
VGAQTTGQDDRPPATTGTIAGNAAVGGPNLSARLAGTGRSAGRAARFGLSKVPEVTAAFWVTKVLTTGMGEAASDYLTRVMDPVVAVGVGAIGFAVAMVAQAATTRYRTWIYWFAVAMVGVFGTMAADVLHVGLHVPYAASTTFYLVVLAVIFAVWYRSERTLSIHSIRTRRREFFYWATVLATFALGTAAGDLTATTMHLGYLASGVLFAVVIAVPAVAWRLGVNPILTFWVAYIFTRPLGASFADYVAVPKNRGGLNAGFGPVTVVMTAAIVVLVGYLYVSERRRGR